MTYKSKFGNIRWDQERIEELRDRLEPYLAALGVGRDAVRLTNTGSVRLRLPVMRKKAVAPGARETQPSTTTATESVPNVAENRENGVNIALETTENAVSEHESTSNSDVSVENVQQESALSRIPVDEKSGEPVFEQAPDHGTAWDGLVEFSNGDKATAKEIADTMAGEKRKEYEKAQNKKPKGKTPPEILASKEAISAELAQAEQEYNFWKQVGNVEQSRLDAVRAQQEAEGKDSETDENGLPFVVSENGSTSFGVIREVSGLTSAPIKLSEGYQDENGKGYGLRHIEAGHGEEIRNAGFSSIEEFVSFVAKNYDENNIHIGKQRANGSTTYIIQVTDAHDNTLFIELSRDGSYWNVNSGGVFRKGYSNKKETVAKTEPQQPNNAVSSDSSLSTDNQSGTSSIEPNGESTVSTGKGNTLPSKAQEAIENVRRAVSQLKDGDAAMESIAAMEEAMKGLPDEAFSDARGLLDSITDGLGLDRGKRWAVRMTLNQEWKHRGLDGKRGAEGEAEQRAGTEATGEGVVSAESKDQSPVEEALIKEPEVDTTEAERQQALLDHEGQTDEERVATEPREARRLSESVRELGCELEEGDVDFEIGKSYALAEGGYMTVMRLNGWSVTVRLYDKDGKLQGTWEEPAYALMRMLDDSVNAEPTATEPTEAQKAAGESQLFQYFGGSLSELISEAKSGVKGIVKKLIAPVSNRLQKDLSLQGVDITGDYNHVIDNNAIRHTLKQHGGKSEEKRGQVPLTEDDFERIEDIVKNYDNVTVESGKRGGNNIIYSKSYPDGTTIFVEEQRTGRKELAAVTMWKHKKSTLTDAKSNETPQISDLGAASAGKCNASVAEKQAVEDESSESCTIDRYVKRGKKGSRELVRVVFPRVEMDVWKERMNLARKMGGEQVPNGYGFKTQEAARAFAEAVINPEAVADAQPLTSQTWDAMSTAEKLKVMESEAPLTEEEIAGSEYRSNAKLKNLYNQVRKNGGFIVEVTEEDIRKDDPSLIQGSKEPLAAGLSALPNVSSADKGSVSVSEKQAVEDESSESYSIDRGSTTGQERTETNNGIDPWDALNRIKSARLRSREGLLDVYWGASDESPSILVRYSLDLDLAYEIKFDGEEWVVNIVPVVVEYGDREISVSVVPVEERHKLDTKLQRRIKTKPQPAMQRDIVSKYVPRELREYFECGEAYEDNKASQGVGAREKVYNGWGIVYAKAGSHGTDNSVENVFDRYNAQMSTSAERQRAEAFMKSKEADSWDEVKDLFNEFYKELLLENPGGLTVGDRLAIFECYRVAAERFGELFPKDILTGLNNSENELRGWLKGVESNRRREKSFASDIAEMEDDASEYSDEELAEEIATYERARLRYLRLIYVAYSDRLRHAIGVGVENCPILKSDSEGWLKSIVSTELELKALYKERDSRSGGAQFSMGNKKTPVAGLPNRANEKQASGSVLKSSRGDSSSNGTASKKALAKVLRRTQSTKRKIKDFLNGDFVVQTDTLQTALNGLGRMLSMRVKGGSRYALLHTNAGQTVEVRISNHIATGNNFAKEDADSNLSIVIEDVVLPRKESQIRYTEATIPLSTYEANPQAVVTAIVKGVEDVLADKPFTLDECIGRVEEKGGDASTDGQFSIDERREPGERTELAHKAVMECLRRCGIEVVEVTQAEALAKAAGAGVDVFETGAGVVYGWTENGRIFLSPEGLDAETPAHEYTHLWVSAMMKSSPKAWSSIVKLLKGTTMWEDVVNDPLYAKERSDDNAVASEMLSRLSGKKAKEYFEREAEKMAHKDGILEQARVTGMIDRVRRAVSRFWTWGANNLFGIKKFKSIDEVTDRVLYDLTSGTRLDRGDKEAEKGNAGTSKIQDAAQTQLRDGIDKSFAERQRKAVADRGTVTPGLADMKIEVVNVPRHDFGGTGKQAIEKARRWALEHLKGYHVAKEGTSGEYSYHIDNDAIGKYLSQSSTTQSENLGVHLAVLKQLPQIINSSVDAEVHANYRKGSGARAFDNGLESNDILIHRLYGAAVIDGKLYRIKTTLKEFNGDQPNQPYNYQVTKLELLISGSETSNALSNSSSITGAKLLEGVEKSYEPGKKLLPDEGLLYEPGSEHGASTDGDIRFRDMVGMDNKKATEERQDLTTTIRSTMANGTKVGISIEEAKKNLSKIKKDFAGIKSTRGFIGAVTMALGYPKGVHQQSFYFELHTPTGTPYTLRISNHNVNSKYADEREISIVVKSKKIQNQFRDDSNEVVKEFVFFKEKIQNGRSDILSQIANDLVRMIETGDYHDSTGIAAINLSKGAMAERVEELSERLGVKVRVLADEAAIEQLPTARRRRAKGWVDGDEVVIVLPNHDSVEDVEETFLHEVVAHRGLREMIGDENYDAFCDEVYRHLKDDLKVVGCKVKIVGVENKRTIQIWYIGGYASESGRIILCISTTGKSNCVVLKDITPFRQIKSVLNDKFRLGFFSDYEECAQLINLTEVTQVPISFIKYITCRCFIINNIHGVNIMNGCIGYINHYRYLRNDIQLCMELDSGFGASKFSPVIDAQAEVNGGGIKCIELTPDTELFIDSGALSLRYHVVGEFLEHSPIAISIASGQDIAVNCLFPESKMKTLLPMGSRNVCQFSETFAAEQLAKHKNEQLTPVRQLPSESSIFNLMFDAVLHDSFKFAFWQKANNLTKNISTCIHGNRDLGLNPNIMEKTV